MCIQRSKLRAINILSHSSMFYHHIRKRTLAFYHLLIKIKRLRKSLWKEMNVLDLLCHEKHWISIFMSQASDLCGPDLICSSRSQTECEPGISRAILDQSQSGLYHPFFYSINAPRSWTCATVLCSLQPATRIQDYIPRVIKNIYISHVPGKKEKGSDSN